ncbi:unnamed protein product, partial [marine sediment metagenome]
AFIARESLTLAPQNFDKSFFFSPDVKPPGHHDSSEGKER